MRKRNSRYIADGDHIEKSLVLCRYIAAGDCCVGGVENRWHQAFNSVLRDFGFPSRVRSFMWDELVCGNWERLHMTDEEEALTADEWLDKLRWEVMYCADRWSIDRLSRCHWLFRAYKWAATRKEER